MTQAVSPRQAMDWLSAGEAMLMDVREASEFGAAHIPYALSAPLGQTSTILQGLDLPVDRKIILQCQKGGRGGQACAAVGRTAPGGQPVFNMEGGIEAWIAAGLPVVSAGKAPVMSLFRQVQIIVGLLVVLGVIAGFAVHPAGFAVAGLFGAALATAGLTGWCGLAILLGKAPWNRA